MEWRSVIKSRFCTHVDPISNPWIRAPSRARKKNRESDFIKFVTTAPSSRSYRIVNPTIERFTTVKSGFLLRRPTCGTLTRYIPVNVHATAHAHGDSCESYLHVVLLLYFIYYSLNISTSLASWKSQFLICLFEIVGIANIFKFLNLNNFIVLLSYM